MVSLLANWCGSLYFFLVGWSIVYEWPTSFQSTCYLGFLCDGLLEEAIREEGCFKSGVGHGVLFIGWIGICMNPVSWSITILILPWKCIWSHPYLYSSTTPLNHNHSTTPLCNKQQYKICFIRRPTTARRVVRLTTEEKAPSLLINTHHNPYTSCQFRLVHRMIPSLAVFNTMDLASPIRVVQGREMVRFR